MKSSRPSSVILLLLIVAIAAFACSRGGPQPVSSTSAGLSSTTTSARTAVTIPDGTQFGFVHDVSAEGLTFDPAEWLSGDAAEVAARAHGEEPVEPFYIENPEVEAVRLPVDGAAQFTLLVYDGTGAASLERTLSYGELAGLWARAADDDVYWADFSSGEVPMRLTVWGGRVFGGREQYIP